MNRIDSKSATAPKWEVLVLCGPPLKVNHEFIPNSHALAFAEVGLPIGMCLGSKSCYGQTHGRHFFVPNAKVFCRPFGKIWWGDLDLWRHALQLERAARKLRCRLYILWEHDGRFERANLESWEVRRRALWHTGGPIRPNRQLIRRSGLTFTRLAPLIGVSAARLAKPQILYIALQINRRLTEFDELFSPLTFHYRFKKWGRWFLSPHSRFNHQTPLQVLCLGTAPMWSDLFPELFANSQSRFRPPGLPALAESGSPQLTRGFEQPSSVRTLSPWIVTYSDFRRYLYRVLHYCRLDRVIFFAYKKRRLALVPFPDWEKKLRAANAAFAQGKAKRVSLSRNSRPCARAAGHAGSEFVPGATSRSGQLLPSGYAAEGVLVGPIAIGLPIVMYRATRNGVARPRIFISSEVREIRLVTRNSVYRVEILPGTA